MKYRGTVSDKVLGWFKKAKPFSRIPMNLTTKEAFKKQCQIVLNDIETKKVAVVNPNSTNKTRICITVMVVEDAETRPTIGLITTVHAVVCENNWLNKRKDYVLALAEDGSISVSSLPAPDKVVAKVNGSFKTLTVRRIQAFSFYV